MKAHNESKLTNKIYHLSVIIFSILIFCAGCSNVEKRLHEPNFYIGRTSCTSCHEKEYKLWMGSHHDKAMDYATDSTVLGDFNDVELNYGGMVHKLYKRGASFFAWTDGEDGTMQEFEIKYVFGFYPLQNYMVEFDKGRIQVLALTWNSMDMEWYHMADSVYKNEKYDHENWLHWTNQAQNWNSMCADCHSTNLEKGYNAVTKEYNTTWSEIDVSCEACHGPSSRHVAWAEIDSLKRPKIQNFGLEVKTGGISSQQFVDGCARCHSRRMAFGDYPHNHSKVYQHTDFSLPRPPEYYIDGQILDEDYVYASFTQSKMYMLNISCKNCHDAHSGELILEGNALCLQCHVAEKYNDYSHHFHQEAGGKGMAVVSESGIRFEVGEGSKCINCHMHGRYYMGVDYRRDHSFRNPRPDLSESLGVPNACNQCHACESVEWAVGHYNSWYGTDRKQHYGEVFQSAQNGKVEAVESLLEIGQDQQQAPVIRRTALEYLGRLSHEHDTILYRFLENKNPGIRLSALRSLEITSIEDVNRVLPLIMDEYRAVRLEVANKLSGLNPGQVHDSLKSGYQNIVNEYLEVLTYNSDFPMGKFSLGNLHYNQGEYQQAEAYYKAALQQDKELHYIKVNLAYLYYRKGDLKLAGKYFNDYLSFYPEDGEIMYASALLLAETKEYEQALKYLLQARELNPENARIDYNIAMMYDFRNDTLNTEQFLLSAISKDSSRIEYLTALFEFYQKYNWLAKAKQIRSMIEAN